MREPTRMPLVIVALLAAVAALLASPRAAAQGPGGVPFPQAVDLLPLGRVAVFTEGRLKSFPSFANTQMQFVAGPKRIDGQSPEFTYLDMLFRPEAYQDADVVYVKNKEVRTRIAQALLQSDPTLAVRMEGFESKIGRAHV